MKCEEHSLTQEEKKGGEVGSEEAEDESVAAYNPTRFV